MLQSNINSASGRLAVVTKEAKERIKRRGRICIQECLAQRRLADVAYRQILPLVPGIAEACFPVPSLEIVAKFSHLTLETDVEQRIPVGELFTSGTDISNIAKPNPRSYSCCDCVNIQSRIIYGERIQRLAYCQTHAEVAKPYL